MSCKKRKIFTLSGYVQGVGFRPFIYRLALEHRLLGFVRNTCQGVVIDVQGEDSSLSLFQKQIFEKKPPRAAITSFFVEEAPLHEAENFAIISADTQKTPDLALLPDTAICSECLVELYDPCNRRFQYPFLHCMSCGPRFSLFLKMPFDRANTSMIDFPMCNECQEEYNTPSNRRFYSQTNCCPSCGPRLELFDRHKNLLAERSNAIAYAKGLLHKGKILAVKNTGGFLLLSDATNENTIRVLRQRKKRPKKPFALLVPSLSFAKQIAYINTAEEKLLSSPAAPIVLLKKKPGLSHLIAFDTPYYGIMLPHSALQYLLLDTLQKPVIATSGNISGMPLCIDNDEAFEELAGIADAFLVHNRRIIHRLDDSVSIAIQDRPMQLRRARGYTPYCIEMPFAIEYDLLGPGGHMKNTFAFAKKDKLYLSQHIGDLDSYETSLSYENEIMSWESLLDFNASQGASDLHSEYVSSIYIQKKQIAVTQVQHHKAHVYSAIADTKLSPPFFSLSWDGTGIGEDHTIWGGEAFTFTENGINRFASLIPFPLPGSEKAVREPRRSLLGLLYALSGSRLKSHPAFTQEEFSILLRSMEKGIHSPVCTSMGRLFDGISALLNCCLFSSFEAEAALTLEALALKAAHTHLCYRFCFHFEKDIWWIQWHDLLQQMCNDISLGKAKEEIALAFHEALVQLTIDLSQKAGYTHVLLTGGCMQNKLFVEKAIFGLKENGFIPHWHENIPPNDGGLAVGQIIGALWEQKYVSSCAG